MKVDKILRCVCSPDSKDDGSIYYGMPQLKVTEKSEFWTVFCPKCGRGGILQYTSQYLALKAWNDMQMELKDIPWLRLKYEKSETGKASQPNTESPSAQEAGNAAIDDKYPF